MIREDKVLKWKYNTSGFLGIPVSDRVVENYRNSMNEFLNGYEKKRDWLSLLIEIRHGKRSS